MKNLPDGIAYTEILQFTYHDHLHLLSKLLGTMSVFGLSYVANNS